MTEISMVISVLVFIILCVYLWNIHAYLRQSKNSLKAIHRILWDQATENIKPESNSTNKKDTYVTSDMVDKAFNKNRDIDR